MPAYQHIPDHVSWCQPNDQPYKHPGKYRHQSLMDHTNAFYLEVIRRPEGKDEEKADEEERPGRVVFLFLSHWFVRWSWSGPDVDVRRRELRSVHSFSTSSMAASVRRLREVSMTRRRKQADRAGACRLPVFRRHSRRDALGAGFGRLSSPPSHSPIRPPLLVFIPFSIARTTRHDRTKNVPKLPTVCPCPPIKVSGSSRYGPGGRLDEIWLAISVTWNYVGCVYGSC